jgi:hypothetical protein
VETLIAAGEPDDTARKTALQRVAIVLAAPLRWIGKRAVVS